MTKSAPLTISFSPSEFQAAILAYYAAHARELPWRDRPLATNDANHRTYLIWLSEIMLQQTTVATVIPYYERFLQAFPYLQDLAQAELEAVLTYWQGLGYYSRAKNLHKCAQTVQNRLAGEWPNTAPELEKLPGIGPYTAAAIAAISFNESAVVVDGNIERVISRVFAIDTPLPSSKPIIKDYAKTLTPQHQPGDYAAALMDLGATICRPKKPACQRCPVKQFCAAHTAQRETDFPRKLPKKATPTKQGKVYVITDSTGQIYLQQRPDKGLLANLYEFPSEGWDAADSIEKLPFKLVKSETEKCGHVRHVFTHFKLELEIYKLTISEGLGSKNAYQLDALPPLPKLMQKVLAVAIPPALPLLPE